MIEEYIYSRVYVCRILDDAVEKKTNNYFSFLRMTFKVLTTKKW